MSDPTQDPAERIAMIASSLHVTHSAEDTSGWERWTLGHNPDGPHHFTCAPTYVIRGPSCLIVSGDMGDMIFERSGGVSLNFARNGFRYVAEKCRAGDPWMYDADKARKDLLQLLQEEITDATPAQAKSIAADIETASELDFEDERGVWQWYYDNVSCDDVPHFGRVPSHLLFRVLGCIEAVRAHVLPD